MPRWCNRLTAGSWQQKLFLQNNMLDMHHVRFLCTLNLLQLIAFSLHLILYCGKQQLIKTVWIRIWCFNKKRKICLLILMYKFIKRELPHAAGCCLYWGYSVTWSHAALQKCCRMLLVWHDYISGIHHMLSEWLLWGISPYCSVPLTLLSPIFHQHTPTLYSAASVCSQLL